MRIIALKALRDCWERHPDAELSLRAWYDEVSKAKWLTPQDIKRRHASASFLGGNRVVFNIRGNEYRLIIAVAYRFEAVYIKFVGSHAQYDAIDASRVDQE
jgi:mRNA interferase HigB